MNITWYDKLYENFTTEEVLADLQIEYACQNWESYDRAFEELRLRGYFQGEF